MKTGTYTYYFESPLGLLKIETDKTFLLSINFIESAGTSSFEFPIIMKNTIQQLQEYFTGSRIEFNLALNPAGTEFQLKIWELVKKVPFGQTASYLEIAKQSGSEKNTRAVGFANGKNPIPVIIPCHRIIGSNWKLTGYAGGIERKRWLLFHELNHFKKTDLLF
jgi:methylated-DNA-[protein]-cysteine S-methyltransferase